MAVHHLELIVEELSMEAFLSALLPRVLPQNVTFQVHSFQGKTDLLAKLPARLRGYSHWLPDDWRIYVLLDRDDDDCEALKQLLIQQAAAAGLSPLSLRTAPPSSKGNFVARIAVEELEAWYFGEWDAVTEVYPRVAATIPSRQGFRDSDAIAGGTWEAFERVLRQYGYFRAGLSKIDAARNIGACVVPDRSRSRSFQEFWKSLQMTFPDAV